MLHPSSPLVSTPTPPVAPQAGYHTPQYQPTAPEYISVFIANFERSINISTQDEHSFAWAAESSTHRSYQQYSPLAKYLAQEPVEEPLPMLAGCSSWRTQLLDCAPYHCPSTPEQISRPRGSSRHKSSTILTPGKDSGVGPSKSSPSIEPYQAVHYRQMASKLMPFGISPQEYKIHSHATNDTPTGQTSSFLKSNGLLSLGPRKHAAGEEESLDNASDTAGSGTNRKKRRVAAIPPRLYVCPWYRHNPNAQHFQVGGRFEKCRTQGVKTDKLKEHVRRVHMKPAQCPKCGRRGDPGEIRFHTEKINCTPKEVIEEVDNETLQQEILLTTRRNITWHVVFAILFPLYTPAPPEGAQYFVDEIEIVADTRPERLAQVLAAHLNSTAKTLEELLNSTEHGDDLVAPNLVAAATRLRAIISSAPFVADSRSQADPPSPGSPAQPYGDPCPDTPDWGSFIDSSQYASDKGDDSVSPTSDLK